MRLPTLLLALCCVARAQEGADRDLASLLPPETLRVLKDHDSPTSTWTLANDTDHVERTWRETDPSSSRQFFDLRVANGCEKLSLDEYPPGR